jgi:hypothetical protein
MSKATFLLYRRAIHIVYHPGGGGGVVPDCSDAQPVFRGTPVWQEIFTSRYKLNDMYKYYSFNLFQTINMFKKNDIIIKMDNYEHQIEHFSVGVDL